jgi:hypothetical protein
MPCPLATALSLQRPFPFCHSERSEESAVRLSGAPNLEVYSHLSLWHPAGLGLPWGVPWRNLQFCGL